MKCQNCGLESAEANGYCPNCGAKLSAGKDDAPGSTQAPKTKNTQNAGAPEESGEAPKAEERSHQAGAAPQPAYPQMVDPENPADSAQSPQPLPDSAPAQAQQIPPGYHAEVEVIPEKKSRRSLVAVIVAAAVVLVVAGSAVAYQTMFSGIGGFFRMITETGTHYAGELKAGVENNTVLSAIAARKGESTTLKMEVDDQEIFFNYDAQQEVVDLEIPIEAGYQSTTDLLMKLFLTKDSLILGVDNILYAQSPYVELGEQLKAFSDRNELELEDELIDVINELALQTKEGRLEATEASKEEVIALYKSFFEHMTFEKSDSRISIGGTEQDCDRYAFTVTTESMKAWSEEKYIPWMEESEDFNQYFDMLLAFQDYGGYMEDKETFIDSYREALDQMPEGYQVTLTFDAYKNVLVRLMLADEDGMEMSVSAIGEDYRLNDLLFTYDDGYDEATLSLRGNHIGQPDFNTEVILTSYDTEDVMATVNWDTDGVQDNLVLAADGEEMAVTFTEKNGEVLFSYDDGWTLLTLLLSDLKDPILLPENTKPIAEVDLSELEDLPLL